MADRGLLELPWTQRRLLGVVSERSEKGTTWLGSLRSTATRAKDAAVSAVSDATAATANAAKAAAGAGATATFATAQTQGAGAAAAVAGKLAASTASATAAAGTAAAGVVSSGAAAVTSVAGPAAVGASASAGAAVAGAVAAAVAAPALPAALAVTAVGAAGVAWWRSGESIGDALVEVVESDCLSLTMPPAHPRAGFAYAVHPFATHRYLPLGAFHAALRQEKHSELLGLLRALGARSARSAAGELWAEAGTVSVRPKIPEDTVWFEHEPSWQEVAKQRLAGGSEAQQLEWVWEDDLGVPVELIEALADAGWTLGERVPWAGERWMVTVEF